MNLSLAALLFALPIAMSAQTMTSYSESGETIILPNLPFHAEQVSHLERSLPDGNLQSREVHESINRDSEGRVLIESKVISSGGSTNSKPNVFYELVDPVAHVSTTWSTLSNTATTQPFSKNAYVRITPSPLAREETSTHPRRRSAIRGHDRRLGQAHNRRHRRHRNPHEYHHSSCSLFDCKATNGQPRDLDLSRLADDPA